jgi:hypothetical protein
MVMNKTFENDLEFIVQSWQGVSTVVAPSTAGEVGPDSFEVVPGSDMGCGYINAGGFELETDEHLPAPKRGVTSG